MTINLRLVIHHASFWIPFSMCNRPIKRSFTQYEVHSCRSVWSNTRGCCCCCCTNSFDHFYRRWQIKWWNITVRHNRKIPHALSRIWLVRTFSLFIDFGWCKSEWVWAMQMHFSLRKRREGLAQIASPSSHWNSVTFIQYIGPWAW